jgi:hypothetical protein
MKKSKLSSLVCSVFLLFSINTDDAFCSVIDYFSYDYHSRLGTWMDASKSLTSDCGNMCWAAAASNVLAWNNWGTSNFNTAQGIFQEFIDHWTDEGGSSIYAWNWWLSGTLPLDDQPGSKVNVTGSGGFWPGYNFWDYYSYTNSFSNIEQDLFSFLHRGYGVNLGLETYNGEDRYGHMVTLWGYQFDLQLSDFTKIYITDSDDGVSQLIGYPITWDGTNTRWELGGIYNDWYISEAFALGHRVAEPDTYLIFFFGLLLIAIASKKKKPFADDQMRARRGLHSNDHDQCGAGEARVVGSNSGGAVIRLSS